MCVASWVRLSYIMITARRRGAAGRPRLGVPAPGAVGCGQQTVRRTARELIRLARMALWLWPHACAWVGAGGESEGEKRRGMGVMASYLQTVACDR